MPPSKAETLRAVIDWLDHISPLDGIFNYPSTIDIVHDTIHDGKHYTWNREADVNGTKQYLFLSGGTLNPHFIQYFSSEGVAHFELYEDPTVTDPGTIQSGTLAPWCNHRINDTIPQMTVYEDPTIGAKGTLRLSHSIGGAAAGGRNIAGIGNHSNEIIMKDEQYWLVEIVTASEIHIDYTATWYEVEST
jgi:hypothetical protein